MFFRRFLMALLPEFLNITLSTDRKHKEIQRYASAKKITIRFSPVNGWLGMIAIAISFGLAVIYLAQLNGPIHWLPCAICLSVFLLGLYALVRQIRFYVRVEKRMVTVRPIFGKKYSFTFSEIIAVSRKVTNSVVLMEKLVIKTGSGKKLVLQNIESGYENFLKKLYSEIDNKIIKEDFIGFSR